MIDIRKSPDDAIYKDEDPNSPHYMEKGLHMLSRYFRGHAAFRGLTDNSLRDLRASAETSGQPINAEIERVLSTEGPELLSNVRMTLDACIQGMIDRVREETSNQDSNIANELSMTEREEATQRSIMEASFNRGTTPIITHNHATGERINSLKRGGPGGTISQFTQAQAEAQASNQDQTHGDYVEGKFFGLLSRLEQQQQQQQAYASDNVGMDTGRSSSVSGISGGSASMLPPQHQQQPPQVTHNWVYVENLKTFYCSKCAAWRNEVGSNVCL